MSEVARIRKLIELECEAMKRVLGGFCMAASHEMINNRFNSLGTLQDELAGIVGESAATQIAVETYIR
ncbi:MAG TPA: hypothetical protein VKX46_17575, partial [Ktedonobacteraceae bacterium]|nr:hypothetical protein [Ktedonobacteraceae bacterium]